MKNSLHSYEGVYRQLSNNQIKEYPLTLDNTAWSGCSISHNEIIGLVIAVGSDTRLEMNSKTNKNIKSTHLD